MYMGLLVSLFWTVSFSQDIERLSLQDAITTALKCNPQAQASARQIDAERGRFWRGISPPLPFVAVGKQFQPIWGTIYRH